MQPLLHHLLWSIPIITTLYLIFTTSLTGFAEVTSKGATQSATQRANKNITKGVVQGTTQGAAEKATKGSLTTAKAPTTSPLKARRSRQPQRNPSSQTVAKALNNHLKKLKGICENHTDPQKQLSIFSSSLDHLKQWIQHQKSKESLTLNDQLILNEIYNRAKELPYKQIMGEHVPTLKKALVIKSEFERIYRHSYNLESEVSILNPWAQEILQTLNCIVINSQNATTTHEEK